MYADRFARAGGISPGSLAMALAVNLAMFGALALSAPGVVVKLRDKVLTTTNVFVPPPPEPVPIEPPPQAAARRAAPSQIERVEPLVATNLGVTYPPLPPLPPAGGMDGGSGIAQVAIDPPPHVPVLTDPAIDARFARDFQPDYPAGERRMENEGKVVVRVLVGTDGRVRRAERVSAASDAFWRTTERQALTRWRFTPATRDGVPIEGWRTLTVRFEIAA